MSEAIRIQDTYPGDARLEGYLQKLKKIINEGSKSNDMEVYITSGLVQVRHILEYILWQYWVKIGKGKEKANPFDQIKELKERGVLNEEQASFLHEVRMAANSAVHNSNKKKVTTMSELVKLGNGLSEFIFTKYQYDIPERLMIRNARRIRRIEPYMSKVPSMAQVQQIKEREKKAAIKKPESISRDRELILQRFQQQKEKEMSSYKVRTWHSAEDTNFYPQACLEEHIISAQEYERVLPTFSLDAIANPGSWENNERLRKLHDKVEWEGAKITSLMFAERTIKHRGGASKKESEVIAISEKSRKKEAEYKKHDVSFLQIILDTLYPEKFGAPWLMMYSDGTFNPMWLKDFGWRRWLFQANIPEKRKKKIQRVHKIALWFAATINFILFLLSIATFTLAIYYLIEPGIVYSIYGGILLGLIPGGILLQRASDWWNAFEKECR